MIFDGYEKYRNLINDAIMRALSEIGNLKLREGLTYALSGGKRLRPCIMLKTCEMLGHETSEILPFACALEFLHTASLIHDDLPALDNDGFRHGLKSNWAQFGEAEALLQGDVLMNFAYEHVTSAMTGARDPYAVMCALSVLAESGGVRGMLDGQYRDVTMSQIDRSSEKEITEMIERKTGRFFIAAVSVPCTLFRAPDDASFLIAFAAQLGLAFQIADDLIDLGYGVQYSGKTLHKDADAHKKTLATVLGVPHAFQRLKISQQEASRCLQQVSKSYNTTAFVSLLDYIIGSVREVD